MIARGRAKDDAAATPLGSTDRTLTGAAGALLTPRLAAAAADLGTALGVMGASAIGSHEVTHALVHHGHVGGDAVHGLAELELGDLLAGDVLDINRRHCLSP